MAKITLNDGTVVEGNVDEIEYLFKNFSNKETEDKTEFKVGDYVKLSIKEGGRPYFGWDDVKNGEIGVIKEIQPDGILRVDFPFFRERSREVKVAMEAGKIGRHPWWFAKPNELIKLSPREATFARAGRKLDEFRNGDIARVLHSPYASPEGTLIEVVEVIGYNIKAKGWCKVRKDIVEYSYGPEDLELVAPAEIRVDTEASD